MNITEAAQKFNLSERTIYEYLKLGFFDYAKKNQKGHWIINSSSLKPYRIPKQNETSIELLIVHILKALNLNQTISKNQHGLNLKKLKTLFNMLELEGYIQTTGENEEDIFNNYMISLKGIEFLNKTSSNKGLMELLKKINFNINLNI